MNDRLGPREPVGVDSACLRIPADITGPGGLTANDPRRLVPAGVERRQQGGADQTRTARDCDPHAPNVAAEIGS